MRWAPDLFQNSQSNFTLADQKKQQLTPSFTIVYGNSPLTSTPIPFQVNLVVLP